MWENSDGDTFCADCKQGTYGDMTIGRSATKKVQAAQIKCLNNNRKPSNEAKEDSDDSDDEEGEDEKEKRVVISDTRCDWVGQLKQWADHSSNDCVLALIACPFAGDGCADTVVRGQMGEHLKSGESKHNDLRVIFYHFSFIFLFFIFLLFTVLWFCVYVFPVSK